jgi:2,3,4,5-tetrahydropyridine-2,6-dicarboxylate N-succinyltransferase
LPAVIFLPLAPQSEDSGGEGRRLRCFFVAITAKNSEVGGTATHSVAALTLQGRVEHVAPAFARRNLLRGAMNDAVAAIIDAAWDARESLGPQTRGAQREAVEEALEGLDAGRLRVAEKTASGWRVHQWLKKAVLLSFRLNDMVEIPGGPADPERGAARWWDKVPSKFAGWSSNRFRDAGFRAVPGSIVRRSAYIAPNVVLMPSFVNVGAYVDTGTMVDTWATVGSCAQIGKNCHLSGGVGIGGVLEPLQAEPVIIEDNCFIGARSEVVEGVIVETGAVLAMGTFIGATTKIVDRETGEILMGRVPAYSVVVPGSLPGKNLPDGRPGPNLYCAVIVKKVDEGTRARTSINELLRE